MRTRLQAVVVGLIGIGQSEIAVMTVEMSLTVGVVAAQEAAAQGAASALQELDLKISEKNITTAIATGGTVEIRVGERVVAEISTMLEVEVMPVEARGAILTTDVVVVAVDVFHGEINRMTRGEEASKLGVVHFERFGRKNPILFRIKNIFVIRILNV